MLPTFNCKLILFAQKCFVNFFTVSRLFRFFQNTDKLSKKCFSIPFYFLIQKSNVKIIKFQIIDENIIIHCKKCM